MAFGVAPAITVSNARGKALTVRAGDVHAARTRFPAGPEPDQEAFALTSVGDRLVELFLGWLLHEHSDRYRSIAAEDQLAWLRQVAILAVARHLVEQKYTRYSDLEAHMRGGLFAPPEALPPLREGARLPFAPLSQAGGDAG